MGGKLRVGSAVSYTHLDVYKRQERERERQTDRRTGIVTNEVFRKAG